MHTWLLAVRKLAELALKDCLGACKDVCIDLTRLSLSCAGFAERQRDTCQMRLQSLCRQSGMCPRQMRTASMSTRAFCFGIFLLPIVDVAYCTGITLMSLA